MNVPPPTVHARSHRGRGQRPRRRVLGPSAPRRPQAQAGQTMHLEGGHAAAGSDHQELRLRPGADRGRQAGRPRRRPDRTHPPTGGPRRLPHRRTHRTPRHPAEDRHPLAGPRQLPATGAAIARWHRWWDRRRPTPLKPHNADASSPSSTDGSAASTNRDGNRSGPWHPARPTMAMHNRRTPRPLRRPSHPRCSHRADRPRRRRLRPTRTRHRQPRSPPRPPSPPPRPVPRRSRRPSTTPATTPSPTSTPTDSTTAAAQPPPTRLHPLRPPSARPCQSPGSRPPTELTSPAQSHDRAHRPNQRRPKPTRDRPGTGILERRIEGSPGAVLLARDCANNGVTGPRVYFYEVTQSLR